MCDGTRATSGIEPNVATQSDRIETRSDGRFEQSVSVGFEPLKICFELSTVTENLRKEGSDRNAIPSGKVSTLNQTSYQPSITKRVGDGLSINFDYGATHSSSD